MIELNVWIACRIVVDCFPEDVMSTLTYPIEVPVAVQSKPVKAQAYHTASTVIDPATDGVSCRRSVCPC